MQKYKIEGNINFFEELNKSLDIDSDEEDNTESPNTCQITGLPLIDKYVKLNCGHSFNYDAIYTEICKQKFDFNTYSIDHLPFSERQKVKGFGVDYFIKCPYCRNIQKELLPYYEDLDFLKKYGVNTTDPLYRVYDRTRCNAFSHQGYYWYGYNFTKGKCNGTTTINDKIIPCYNSFAAEIPGLGKTYCQYHIKSYDKKYKADERLKKKKQKEDLKAELKAKKEELKKNKTKVTNNVVLQTNIVNEFVPTLDEVSNQVNTCKMLLKTGPRKGLPCGTKVFNDGFCKRHCCKVIEDQNKKIEVDKIMDEVK